MAILLPSAPNTASASFSYRTTTTASPVLHRPHHYHRNLFHSRHFLRGSLSVARFGFKPGFIPEPHGAEELIKDLFNRADAFLYTVADAAVSSSDTMTTTAKQNNDWLSGITGYLESVLKVWTTEFDNFYLFNKVIVRFVALRNTTWIIHWLAEINSIVWTLKAIQRVPLSSLRIHFLEEEDKNSGLELWLCSLIPCVWLCGVLKLLGRGYQSPLRLWIVT